MWTDLKRHLIENDHRVICVDLLGHGQTGCIGYIHTMGEMADAVYEVIKMLGIKYCSVIGHSMGGYVALAYTEKYPEKVKHLCLMNSTFLPDHEEKQKNRDRAIAAVKNDHKMFIRLSISNLFALKNRKRLESQIEEVRKEALKTPLRGIVAALEGMKIRPNRINVLKDNNFTKSIIIGHKDPVLNYDKTIESIHELDIEIIEFPDGHMSHIENKKELTYKILHLIEK